MKKLLVGLIALAMGIGWGMPALAESANLAQSSQRQVIATTVGANAINVVAKTGGDEDHFGKLAKGDPWLDPAWKSASSDSGTFIQAPVILSARANFDHNTVSMKSLPASFALATTTSVSPPRDSIAFFTRLAGVYGEKTCSMTILGTGASINIALEPNDYGWSEGKSTS